MHAQNAQRKCSRVQREKRQAGYYIVDAYLVNLHGEISSLDVLTAHLYKFTQFESV